MRKVMILLSIATILALAGLAGRPTLAADAPAAVTAKVRIGVYDTRAIALAYGRSKANMDVVGQAQADHKKAKEAGDEKRMKEIEAKMVALQDKMHWQVFSNWNIDDILPLIKPNYADIAKKAGVSAIVASVDYKDDSVEAVDVTELMASQFAPDAKTLEIMKGIRKQPPLPLEEIKKVRTED